MENKPKLTPEQKKADKLGKAIQKLIGDKQFILISYENTNNGKLETLSNIQSKIERIGLLELSKSQEL